MSPTHYQFNQIKLTTITLRYSISKTPQQNSVITLNHSFNQSINQSILIICKNIIVM